MAGNKHKNGIVCMFPGCEKKMRTQKFKGHFMKIHLREGEEYTVEHRRQFEVAQTEPMYETSSASASPMDLMGAAKIKTDNTTKREVLEPTKKAAEAVMASIAGIQPQLLVAPEPLRTAEATEQPAPTPAAQLPVIVPQPLRAKRPAAAISTDEGAPPLRTEVAMVEDTNAMVGMLLHLDRRVNELHMKMDEIIEMQRLLFAAAMPKESLVDEQAAKKRKEVGTSLV